MGTRGRTAALLVVLTAVAAAPAAGQDPTGRWEARWASAIRTERDGSITIQRRSDAVLVLEAAGDSLAGTWTFELPATGRSVWTVVGQRFGDRLSLMATENETERPPPPSQGTIARQEWRGTVADGRIEGEMWMVLSLPGGEERRSGPRPWSAVRSGG